MIIRASLAPLRQTAWRELLLRFALGGTITALAGLIAMEFGPVLGGLFLAFPAILPASLTLVEKHEMQKKAAKGLQGHRRAREAAAADAAGAILGSCGMVVFGFIVWQLASSYEPWFVLTTATLAWLTVSIGLWSLRKMSVRTMVGNLLKM